MKLAVCLTSLLSLSLALTPRGFLAAQEPERKLAPDSVANGIDVQTRGPVHEAFAELVDPSPRPSPIVPKQPPGPIKEVPPEQKPEGENVYWIPGYWAWDTEQNNYLWVSGFWRVPPPNRQWTPGYWSETDGGWQWTPGLWASAQQQQFDYVPEPPPDSIDNGPSVPAPDDNSFYVPGNWLYEATGYVWRPGYWTAIRPGYCWIPAHYCWTPAGYSYVSGYWDYPPEDRGLLFAPVAFSEPLWLNPDWYYRPSYCLNVGDLLSWLFCRPRYCHYYFGDYFGAGYYDAGYYPWFAYGRRWHSPLFGYYAWQHRGERGWYNGLVRDYRARATGDLARSPRGLVMPLHDMPSHGVRLAHVDPAQVNAARERASAFRSRAVERRRFEHSGRPTAPSLAHAPSNRGSAGFGAAHAQLDRGRGYPAFGSQPQHFAAPSFKHSAARPNAEFHAQPHQPATLNHSAPANIRPHEQSAPHHDVRPPQSAPHHAAPTVHHEQPKHDQAPAHHASHAASHAAAQPRRSAPAQSASHGGGHATPHASAPAHHAAPASHSGGGHSSGGHSSSGGSHDKKKH
jgi:hypothetical protein